MGNKKIFEFLNLLSVLVRTGEINLKSYAATTGLSERTLRRYFADLREFFGAENFILTERGNVGITDKNLLSSLTLPSEKEKLEFQKLADLLHVINPGFTEVLPPAYKRVDEKLAKELADIFLIKGSPHEKPPKIGVLIKLRKAIGFKKYCDITYEDETIKSAKALKIIYSKGNWQLAIIDAQNPANNGFRIIRIKFIKEVVLRANTFNLSEYTRKFLLNMESFYDGYDVEPYMCEVAVAPKILKFFEAKKCFRSQKIGRKFKNGWSLISYEISSDDMILMLAQRFFPHFVILSPRTAREKFNTQIREYLRNEELEFD